MSRLIYAEALKLRTTRTFYLLTLCALLIVAVAGAALIGAGTFGPTEQPVRDALAVAALSQTFAVVIGVLVVTGEFRYGTITSAFLITPKRLPLLAAKVITCALAGLVFGALAFGAVVGIALAILPLRGITNGMTGTHIAGMILGGAVATALVAVLGVGLGTVVRNQAGAIVLTLGFLYALEPLLTILPGIGNAIATYGFGGLSSAASGSPPLRSSGQLLSPVPACLLLALYAGVFVVAGAILMRRRDIGE